MSNDKENIEQEKKNKQSWWRNVGLNPKLLTMNFICLIIVFLLFVNFHQYFFYKTNNIITKSLPNMKQYHANHLAINLDNGNVIVLGNNISYGITEMYLHRNKKFKIYNKNFLGSYLLYADKNYICYSNNNNISCFNPLDELKLLFKINLNNNIIHPNITFINQNQFLIWGGYYKQNKISNEWKIYDIKSKKIISEGHFNTKIYEDSKLVQIEPNILLLCSNNNIYKINTMKSFSKCNIINSRPMYNIEIYKDIRVSNSVLVSYSETINGENLEFGLLDIKNNNLQKIKTTFLNHNFKYIVFDSVKLLLFGASTSNDNHRGIYLFDTETCDLKFMGNMKYNRTFHNAILLNDNKTVLITGGSYDDNPSNGEKTAEYFIIRR